MKLTNFIKKECYQMITSMKNTYLAIGLDGGIAIYKFLTAEEIVNIKLPYGPQNICFSSNEEYVAFVWNGGKICVCDCATGKEVSRGNVTKEKSKYLFFSEDGKYIYNMDSGGVFSRFDWNVCKNYILLDLKKIAPWNKQHLAEQDFEHFWSVLPETVKKGDKNPLGLDKNIARKNYLKPECRIRFAYKTHNQEYVFDAVKKILRWKYPFNLNDYIIQDPNWPTVGDIMVLFCESKGYYAILIDYITSKIEIYDQGENLLYTLPELSGTPIKKTNLHYGMLVQYDKYAIAWAPNGEYLAVTIVESDLKMDKEKRTLKIYQSKDWTIVKEYILPGIHFVGFSGDSKYLLLGTSLGGYCIEIADFLS